MSWFGNISIRYKITFISLIGMLGFLVFQLINYRLSVFTTEELKKIERADFPVLEIINETHIHFMDMGRMYESAVAEGDIEIVDEAKQLSDSIVSELTKIKVLMPLYETDIDTLLDTFGYYSTSVHLNAINFIQSDNDVDSLSDNAMYEALSHVRVLRERFDREHRTFRERLNSEFGQKIVRIQKQSEATVSQGFVLGVLLFLALFFASFSIIRQITTALNNAVSIAHHVANGKLSSPIQSKYNDETGLLIKSLAIMRDALKRKKEEDDLRQINQRRVTELNETMRGDKTLEELGRGVLGYLANSFGAMVGAFWILEDDKKVLTRVASYALSAETQKKNKCVVGEGLVGEAVQHARSYHCSDLPTDYLAIESGVGQAEAGSLLVVPFQHEGEIRGVLELASFSPFNENDIAFINRYNTGIAIAVSSSQSRLKMSTILKKTQLQAQELEQQGAILQTKSEQLELSGRYKSQFLSTMSHELRTPLNSILILSKGLVENKHNNLLPKQQEHAKVIYAAGSDLLTLINDILDLSKVEEGKLDLIIDEIDTVEFSRIIYHQFEYEAESKTLDFEVTVSDKLPQFFYADIHRLSQILRNFLSNALKFTEKGYVQLSIEPTLLQPGTDNNESAIAFIVSDSGIGISKDKQDSIFEAFQQADGTTSRQYGGTGLGLTISRELSELMRGYITVSSKGEGEGSIFTLVLPIDNRDHNRLDESGGMIPARVKSIPNQGKPTLDSSTQDIAIRDASKQNASIQASSVQRHSLKSTLSPPLPYQNPWVENAASLSLVPAGIKFDSNNTYHILLVEDDRVQVESIKKMCSEQNLKLDTAVTAQDARTLIEAKTYDCLILDLNLPDENSISLLRELRQREAQSSEVKRLFTIVYTAETVTRDTESELQAIADRIIIKTQRSLEWLSNEIQQFFMFEFGDQEALTDQTNTVEASRSMSLSRNSSTASSQNKTRKESQSDVSSNAQSMDDSADLMVSDDQTLLSDIMDNVTSANTGSLKGKSVLIVDDDMRNIYSLSAAFEDFDMSVYTAENGEEAVAFLNEHIDKDPVDIVLMDIMMPVLNGLDATKRIREIPGLTSTPIIALTAKAMPDDKLNCILAGANAYISKPVDIPELEKHLLNFIG